MRRKPSGITRLRKPAGHSWLRSVPAFRLAAQETDRLGLELTVARSPGWSLTGGPWVKPRDGLKKVVWSETVVEGGRGQPVKLAQPPTVSGPFQDIPLKPEPGADPKHVVPEHYRDIAVLGWCPWTWCSLALRKLRA